jgi:hypothetical protein
VIRKLLAPGPDSNSNTPPSLCPFQVAAAWPLQADTLAQVRTIGIVHKKSPCKWSRKSTHQQRTQPKLNFELQYIQLK